jgi:hypothetical protein
MVCLCVWSVYSAKLSSLLTCCPFPSPSSSCPTDPPTERSARGRASVRASERILSPEPTPILLPLNATRFFRLLAVRVAYSRPLRCQAPCTQCTQCNATQCNAIGVELHFHLLRICPPPAIPIAALLRSSLGSFRREEGKEKARTACSETRGNHCLSHARPFSTPPPTSLICPVLSGPSRHHLRSFNPLSSPSSVPPVRALRLFTR